MVSIVIIESKVTLQIDTFVDLFSNTYILEGKYFDLMFWTI